MKEKRSKIRNIGPVSEKWLESIGIFSTTDVKELGVDKIMLSLQLKGYNPSLNLAYALQGALLDCHWLELPQEVKAELQRKFKK